jgi:cobalamin biosynthesis protein CobT
VIPSVLNLYTRFGGLDVLEIKKFNERWQDVNWRVLHMHAEENNYDAESVLLSARRLAQRKEKRKILLVMSDGIPSCDPSGESRAPFEAYLHRVIKEIRMTGIELIGIGINCQQVGVYYAPDFLNVTNVSELPGVAIATLKQVLLNTKSRGGRS